MRRTIKVSAAMLAVSQNGWREFKRLDGVPKSQYSSNAFKFYYVADAYGKSTIFAANFFLAVDLSDRDYKFGLAIFETRYHTILNVNESNNKFYFTVDDAELQFLSVRTKCET